MIAIEEDRQVSCDHYGNRVTRIDGISQFIQPGGLAYQHFIIMTGGTATREELWVLPTSLFPGGPPSAANTATRAGPSASSPATASTASARDTPTSSVK